MSLMAPEQRPMSFWHFAGSVMAGNAAAVAAVYLTRKAFERDSEAIRNTAAAFTGLAAFWLAGGLTWVALSKRVGA